VFKLKKRGKFAYLRWRILNKISIKTWMLKNRVLLWLEKLWEVELCWDWGGWGGGRLFCCREILQGRSRNEEWGEEGWAPGHILNITDGFFDRIIPTVTPLVILLVSMPHHCTVCLFEFHCNFIGNCICKNIHVIALFVFFNSFYSDCYSLGIYQWHISFGVYR